MKNSGQVLSLDSTALSNQRLRDAGAWGILSLIAALAALVQLLHNPVYGLFRDEYYYIACSNRLDWGYVDHPPLSILVLRLVRTICGESLFSVRIVPALAESSVVLLTGYTARLLGGGLFAQILAAAAVLCSPIFLAAGSFFSMNSIEHVFWISAVVVLIHLFRRPDSFSLWLVLGVLMGLGFQNKISMAFLGLGVFLGMVCTPARSLLLRWKPWAAVGVAVVLMSPYILWQFFNGFATVEFMTRAAALKNLDKSVLEFLSDFVVIAHPINTILWGIGLVGLILRREWKEHRPLAGIFIVPLALCLCLNGKSYYLAGALPLLLAAGAAVMEKWTQTGSLRLLRPAILIGWVLGGSLALPLSIPMLEPETFLRYSKALGIQAPQEERGPQGPLPQIFADRLGWIEMADDIQEIFQKLEPKDREVCAILAGNYGEAAALDFHRESRGLPMVVSTHNNYFLWGLGGASPEILVTVGFDVADLTPHFKSVLAVGALDVPYAQESGAEYYICREPLKPAADLFRLSKNYI